MQCALLSVVIPFYNAKSTVLRAARSVVNQPCAERIELLLMDDGSKDEGGKLCDQFALDNQSSAKIRVIHKENGGASSAMNLGIQQASGQYICFLDADDWWEPGFFDDHLVRLLEEDYDLYNFSYQTVSPDMRWHKSYLLEDTALRDLQPDCYRDFYVRHWACIHRREHLLRHDMHYPLCNVNEDVPFVHLASAFAGSIRSCSRVMVNYWLNPKSCVHTSSPQTSTDEIMKSLRLEREMFRERGLDYSNDRDILSHIIRQLPLLCSQMSYRNLRAYLRQPEFALLWQETVKPWREFCRREASFKKHPFLFWLRSRISPGFSQAAKPLLYSSPLLMRLACLIRYRLRLGWDKLS